MSDVGRVIGLFPGVTGVVSDGAALVTFGSAGLFWLLVRRRQVPSALVFSAALWLQPLLALGIATTEGTSFAARATWGEEVEPTADGPINRPEF